MAVTNPAMVVAFMDQKGRPMAEAIIKAYWLAKNIVAYGNALGIFNVATPSSSFVPNDTTVIPDAASTGDGRPVIQGADVYNAVAMAQTLINAMEANGNQKLSQLMRLAVNVNP